MGWPTRPTCSPWPTSRTCPPELTFDPFDLTDIDVRHHGRPAGQAAPFQIHRHVHRSRRNSGAVEPEVGAQLVQLTGSPRARWSRHRSARRPAPTGAETT